MPEQDNHKESTKTLMAFIIAMGVIFLLILHIIFRKPDVIVQAPDRSKILRDSIKMLSDQIDSSKAVTAQYIKIADSLSSLPPKIKYIYNEQKKLIPNASILQLDSITRANTGLSPRRQYR